MKALFLKVLIGYNGEALEHPKGKLLQLGKKNNR